MRSLLSSAAELVAQGVSPPGGTPRTAREVAVDTVAVAAVVVVPGLVAEPATGSPRRAAGSTLSVGM